MAFSWQTIFAKSLIRPFALFAQEPIIQLFGVYMAYLYGIMYREWFDIAQSRVYSDVS